jgi:hypothetical protein
VTRRPAILVLRWLAAGPVAYLAGLAFTGAWAEFRDKVVDLAESGDDEAVAAFLDGVERLAGSPSDAVRNVVEIAFLEEACCSAVGAS